MEEHCAVCNIKESETNEEYERVPGVGIVCWKCIAHLNANMKVSKKLRRERKGK